MNERFLERLKDVALGLFDPEKPVNFHCSFIIWRGRILAIGLNDVRTSPRNLLNPKFGRDGKDLSPLRGSCSEWRALRRVQNTMNIPFKKTTMVNIRVGRDKRFRLSRPCESCRSLLKFFGLEKVLWTNDSGEFVCN